MSTGSAFLTKTAAEAPLPARERKGPRGEDDDVIEWSLLGAAAEDGRGMLLERENLEKNSPSPLATIFSRVK